MGKPLGSKIGVPTGKEQWSVERVLVAGLNSLRGINPSQIVTVEFAQDLEDVGVGRESRKAKVNIHSRLKVSLRRSNMLKEHHGY